MGSRQGCYRGWLDALPLPYSPSFCSVPAHFARSGRVGAVAGWSAPLSEPGEGDDSRAVCGFCGKMPVYEQKLGKVERRKMVRIPQH